MESILFLELSFLATELSLLESFIATELTALESFIATELSLMESFTVSESFLTMEFSLLASFLVAELSLLLLWNFFVPLLESGRLKNMIRICQNLLSYLRNNLELSLKY